MAQIIKFQTGGSTSRRYGTFTIDGNQYQVDDDFLNQITNYGKSLDNETAYQFSKITDALKSGANLSYDSNADRLDGNVQFDVTDSQDSRLTKRRSRIGRLFGNSWRGKENTARNAIHALKGFTYIKPTPGGTKYDWSKGINVEYKRDKNGEYELDNGKRVFIQGANNLQALRRLDSLPEIIEYTNNDTFKGYGGLQKQAYIDLYNRLGPEGIKALRDRIETGTWTNEDKLALDDIGIFLDPSVNRNNTQGNQTEQELNRKLEEKGISSPNSSKYVTIDSNGNLIVTDLFNQTFGDKNAIYNDWWQQYMSKTNQWNPDFSFLNGYTRLGNRLYKTSDLSNENSDLYKFARQKGGFYDLNASNKFGEANSILEYLWGKSDDSSKFDNNNLYSSWFSSQSPNLRYRPLTGTRQLPEGQQLIEYWDNNDKDMYGRPSVYKYALLDSYGNLIQDNVNVNDFSVIDDGEQVGLSALQKINQHGSPYHGRYIMNFSDPSGSIEDYELYIDPNDPNDIILKSNELNNWNATKGKNIRIPKELAKAINSNPNFWNNLMQNKTLQNRFIRSLAEGVRSKVGDALTTVNPLSTSTLEISDLEKLGFDRNVAEAIYNYLENNYGDRNGSSLWTRRNQRLVSPYQPVVPAHQKGGVIGTTKDAVGNNKTNKVSSYKDPSKTAGINDNWSLSHADKLQIASIAGDVASLIAAIPTGGNPVAGALGYGSTLAQFGADISRDGFDLKDIGNLALGLGLDTISLLPGIGISGKLAKMGKTVKKSASLLKNTLLAAGAINAVDAVNNIASGKGTLDDWKSLSTGLFAIKGIKNEVQNIRSTQYKGKAPKAESKTKEDLKKEYIDKIVSSKKLGFVDGNPARWANSDGTVKDYNQAIEDLTKSGNLKISKSQEAKWTAQAAKSKTDAALSNIISGSYNPFSKNYRFRMSNRQLPEEFNLSSLSGHTSKLRTLGRLVNQNPEIAKQLQDSNWILPTTLQFSSRHGGNWLYRSPIFSRFLKINVPTTSLLPEGSGIRDIPVTLSGRISPTEVINIDPYTQSIDDYIGLRFHKKGGKISKAKNGTNSNWFLDSSGKPLTIKGDPIVVTGKPIVNNRNLQEEMNNTYQEGLLDLDMQNVNKSGLDIINKSPEATSGIYGHSPNNSTRLGISTDSLLGLGDFIASTRGINRTSDKMKEAIRKGMRGSQQDFPAEYYSRFSDNGLHKMYDDRIKAMSQYKTTSNDPNQIIAERLMRDLNIDRMKNERDTKFSQMIDQYNDKLLSQKQQYANIRSQIANENKNRWQQGLAQLDMTEANRIGQQTQNIKNLLYQFRQDNARDIQERQQAELVSKQLHSQNAFEAELSSKFRPSYSSEMKNKYKTFEDFVLNEYPREYSDLKNKYFANLYINTYNDSPAHSWWGRKKLVLYDTPYKYNSRVEDTNTIFRKSGGTIPRFRSTNEQAFLDQQKAINKAIGDLNNNIIKLFIKMTS